MGTILHFPIFFQNEQAKRLAFNKMIARVMKRNFSNMISRVMKKDTEEEEPVANQLLEEYVEPYNVRKCIMSFDIFWGTISFSFKGDGYQHKRSWKNMVARVMKRQGT